MVHCHRDRRSIRGHVLLVDAARYQLAACARPYAAGRLGVDHSFSRPAARVDLAVRAGLVLHSRLLRAGMLSKSQPGDSSEVVAPASAHAVLGQRAWWIPARVCSSWNLLAGSALGMGAHAARSARRRIRENRRTKENNAVDLRRPAFSRRQLRQSLRMEIARAHLLLSFQPLPDGSHRGVSITQLSWDSAEVFSAVAADHSGCPGAAWPRAAREPLPDCAVCCLHGPLLLAEYSRVVRVADDHRGAADFHTRPRLPISKTDDHARFGLARPRLVHRRERGDFLHRSQRRACWI